MDNTNDNVLKIDINVNGTDANIALAGRLDTLRAMTLDEKLNELPDEVCNFFFDFAELEYIASAGLRILFWAEEVSEEKGGKTTLSNVSKEVRDVLHITGFDELVTIK